MRIGNVRKILLVAVVVLAMLTGCAAKGNSADGLSQTGGEMETNIAENEVKEVFLWYYWEAQAHQDALDGIIQGYNTSQEDIKVVAEYVPFADFKKQLSIGVSAERLPDIVLLDGPDHASYAEMGIFADVTEKLDGWEALSHFFEGPLESCKLNGRLYGVPFGCNTLSLFYNEDMLEAAGVQPPTTWDEFLEVAKKTTQGDVTGFAMSALQNEEGTFNFSPWLWGTGATSYDIDNENGIKAFELVKELIDSGSMSKEVINWTQGDVKNQFISENVATMINGPWQVPVMREEVPDLNWNVVLLPVGAKSASSLGGENFGIINGERIDESLDFIKYAASKENVESYINKFGHIAARKDVAEIQFSEDEIMQVFAEQMESTLPRGPHPDWPGISDAISTAVNEVIIGVSTPEEAASSAQKVITAITE